MNGEAALVGRDAELARLRTLLSGDSPAVTVIEGVAGVGKSRLLWSLLEGLGGDVHAERILGVQTLRTIPFGAVSHLVPHTPSVDATNMLATVRSVLLERSAGRPTVLAVDDAHVLDDATVALLQQMLGHRETRVVLTVRELETVTDPVAALWRDGQVEVIRLEPLSEVSTSQLAEAVLGGPVDPALRVALWNLSRGHPLYAVLALRAGVAAGTVVADDDGWHLRGDLSTGQLHKLIRARTRQLDPDTAADLRLLALAGPLPRAHLGALVDATTLEQLVGEGLATVVPQGDTMVVSVHPLVTEVVRDALSVARRSEHYERLVDTLGRGRAADDPDVGLRVATWMLELQRPVDGTVLVGAAREAMRRGDLGLAERLARAACDDPSVASSARILLGRTLGFAGRADEAVAVLAEVRPSSPDDHAEVALERAHVTAFGLGDPQGAIAILQATAAELSADLRWRLDVERSIYSAFAGDFRSAYDAAQNAIGNDRTPGEARTTAYVNLTLAQAMTGDFDAFAGVIDTARQLAVDHQAALPLATDQIGLSEASVLASSGRLGDARRLCDDALATMSTGPAPMEPAWHAWRGIVIGLQGQVREAVDVLQRSVMLYEVADPFRLQPQSVGLVGLHQAQTGPAPAELATVLERARQQAAGETRLVSWIERAEAWRLAWIDPDGAVKHALEHGRRSIVRDHAIWGAWALHDAVRWGRAEVVADDLAAAVAGMTGARLLEAMGRHATALAEQDLPSLEDVALQFLAFGSPLLAAEVFAQLSELLRDHRDDHWRRSAARAQMLAMHCPDAMTPAIAGIRAALTTREFEITLDALRDATSREIAKRRYLSVRTVDNHLHAVYRKLRVAGRPELASLLGPVAPTETATDQGSGRSGTA